MLRRVLPYFSSNNASPATKSIQLIFIGDSITGGEGTTGTGSSTIGPYNGGNSYPEQTMPLLSSLDATPLYLGFPGEYASLFNTDGGLDLAISMFDFHNYTDVYCVLFFGANDLLSYTASQFQTYITTTCGALKAAGAKVILLPVLSRKDIYAAGVSYINITRRNTFNAWLAANYATIADATVDLTPYPNIFDDNAPDNATYFNAADADGLYKVHPTDTGAGLIAQGVATSVLALSLTSSIINTDPDEAALFLTATGITDVTISAAINNLVTELKNAKLWNRFVSVYPFVGGTAGTNKFNLKDPRNLDAAYRLTFTGSPTHDANGVTWASGSYADTHYIQPAGNKLFAWNLSLSYYSRTDGSAGVDAGNSTARLSFYLGGQAYDEVNNGFTGGQTISYTSALGMFTTSRYTEAAPSHSLYRNGVLDHTVNLGSSTAVTSPYSLFIGAENDGGSTGYPSNRNCAYFAITHGHGLTAAEEAIHDSIIQAFQVALGRAV